MVVDFKQSRTWDSTETDPRHVKYIFDKKKFLQKSTFVLVENHLIALRSWNFYT